MSIQFKIKNLKNLGFQISDAPKRRNEFAFSKEDFLTREDHEKIMMEQNGYCDIDYDFNQIGLDCKSNDGIPRYYKFCKIQKLYRIKGKDYDCLVSTRQLVNFFRKQKKTKKFSKKPLVKFQICDMVN